MTPPKKTDEAKKAKGTIKKPTWSVEEERLFWGIIARFEQRNWEHLAREMEDLVARRCPAQIGRRNYTAISCSEHFFQNHIQSKYSPNARRFVDEYRSWLADPGNDDGHSTNSRPARAPPAPRNGNVTQTRLAPSARRNGNMTRTRRAPPAPRNGNETQTPQAPRMSMTSRSNLPPESPQDLSAGASQEFGHDLDRPAMLPPPGPAAWAHQLRSQRDSRPLSYNTNPYPPNPTMRSYNTGPYPQDPAMPLDNTDPYPEGGAYPPANMPGHTQPQPGRFGTQGHGGTSSFASNTPPRSQHNNTMNYYTFRQRYGREMNLPRAPGRHTARQQEEAFNNGGTSHDQGQHTDNGLAADRNGTAHGDGQHTGNRLASARGGSISSYGQRTGQRTGNDSAANRDDSAHDYGGQHTGNRLASARGGSASSHGQRTGNGSAVDSDSDSDST